MCSAHGKQEKRIHGLSYVIFKVNFNHFGTFLTPKLLWGCLLRFLEICHKKDLEKMKKDTKKVQGAPLFWDHIWTEN